MDVNHQVYTKNGMSVIHETFSSINQLLNVISTRKNNPAMESANSSMEKGDKDWYGTETYSEATELIVKGYTDILDRVKSELAKRTKSLSDFEVNKSSLVEDVQGYVPIVPNYLLGLPKSMSFRKPIAKKIKTINVVYAPTENCGTGVETFIESGVALLAAIRAIEKNNISVRLDCIFTDSKNNSDLVIGSVRIKNYRDRLDLQKICFPLAHPSMLRRIGFKHLETVPDLTNEGFAYGYGSTPDLEVLEKSLNLASNVVLMNLRLIKGNLQNDPKKIIEYINNKINE